MSTAAHRSASLCLVLGLILTCLMTATSGTADADDRIDHRAVDRWISDYVQTEGLSRGVRGWFAIAVLVVADQHGTAVGPANTPIPSGSLG